MQKTRYNHLGQFKIQIEWHGEGIKISSNKNNISDTLLNYYTTLWMKKDVELIFIRESEPFILDTNEEGYSYACIYKFKEVTRKIK